MSAPSLPEGYFWRVRECDILWQPFLEISLRQRMQFGRLKWNRTLFNQIMRIDEDASDEDIRAGINRAKRYVWDEYCAMRNPRDYSKFEE